jgi:phosphatidylinositol-binding clathrin assembly protein
LLQRIISACVACDFQAADLENVVVRQAYRLIVTDLMSLFHILNEAIIVLLGLFFGMSHSSAVRGNIAYKKFTDLAKKAVDLFEVGRQMRRELQLDIPKFTHPPTSLTASLEKYLNAPDFEAQRKAYSKKNDNTPSFFKNEPQNSTPAPTQANKKQDQLIDFFDSLDNEQARAVPSQSPYFDDYDAFSSMANARFGQQQAAIADTQNMQRQLDKQIMQTGMLLQDRSTLPFDQALYGGTTLAQTGQYGQVAAANFSGNNQQSYGFGNTAPSLQPNPFSTTTAAPYNPFGITLTNQFNNGTTAQPFNPNSTASQFGANALPSSQFNQTPLGMSTQQQAANPFPASAFAATSGLTTNQSTISSAFNPFASTQSSNYTTSSVSGGASFSPARPQQAAPFTQPLAQQPTGLGVTQTLPFNPFASAPITQQAALNPFMQVPRSLHQDASSGQNWQSNTQAMGSFSDLAHRKTVTETQNVHNPFV